MESITLVPAKFKVYTNKPNAKRAAKALVAKLSEDAPYNGIDAESGELWLPVDDKAPAFEAPKQFIPVIHADCTKDELPEEDVTAVNEAGFLLIVNAPKPKAKAAAAPKPKRTSKKRTLIDMLLVERLTIAEIAMRLGVSKVAASSLLQDIRHDDTIVAREQLSTNPRIYRFFINA